jgi:hypothetical protein|tara:strand:+ start:100 stop:480 length:381 start_codon:yes stop_codon:yes gene_type:complete
VDEITKRVARIEDEVLMLKRNLASWMTFADESRVLPIVSYRSSYNGKDTLETVSDLSQLVPEAQEVISDALEEWHGAAVIKCLGELGKTIKQLERELLGSPAIAAAVTGPLGAAALVEESDDEFSS